MDKLFIALISAYWIGIFLFLFTLSFKEILESPDQYCSWVINIWNRLRRTRLNPNNIITDQEPHCNAINTNSTMTVSSFTVNIKDEEIPSYEEVIAQDRKKKLDLPGYYEL